MKPALVLFAVLLFACSLAWAQPAGSATAPVADPRVAGGGCLLPSFTGLNPEQKAAAAMNAGLRMIFKTTLSDDPPCPEETHCDGDNGCGPGPLCNTTDIGPCCTQGSETICCAGGGDIKVKTCHCKCFGILCTPGCTGNDVSILPCP